MMSSVDLSRGASSSSQLSPGRQHVRYGAPPPRSSSSSAGRTKTEAVVLEFLYKAAELIVQSRVNFQAEPGLRRGSRRARFNLDIEEVSVVRDAMAAWKEDARLPLAIDIFYDADGQKVLLERWCVTFEAEAASAHLGSTQDVIQQLKEVCKRISVLLRALFSFMRQLPAHRLFAQSYPSMLSYVMHAAPASDAARAFKAQRVATSGYAFIPIATPFGLLKVAAVYRRDCDRFTEQQEQAAPSRIFQDNFIIQDYVPGSPEMVPASAPVTSAAMADSPMRAADLRSDSFVPVSDARQFGGDAAIPPRRRSTPRSIPMATPQQQLSSTGPVGDSRDDDSENTVRTQPGMSKPMAIPRVSSKPGITAGGGRDATEATGYGDEQSDGKLMQQAHSYGGEDDVRLRGAAANPNVTAAPYGYGNVAIEREQQPTSSPSLAFQQRQQQLWEGGATHSNTEKALQGSHSSLHDEPPTSNSNAAYHRLSTPPRHPKTMSLLRNGRMSPALPPKPFLAGHDSHPAPGSLDNFTLDSGSPSPVQQYVPRRRKSSFNGAFVSDSGESSSIREHDTAFTEAEGTQLDVHMRDATTAANTATKTEAITIRPSASKHSSTDGMPMFSSSPPFQANPCELLSTSPGYSYSKNYPRSGSSNVPTFITTDQFQHGIHGAKRSSFSSSAGLISAKARGFSPDFSDSGVAAWGVSPDTPDAFGLALVGTGGSSSGGRPRFLSLSGGADGGADGGDGQGDGLDADMILPFAMSDGSAIRSSATTAADSVSTGVGSTLNHSSYAASVGSFLHQLKNAPRLAISASTLTAPVSEGMSKVSDEEKQDAQAPTSLFDDELAGFRSLRDELAQVL